MNAKKKKKKKSDREKINMEHPIIDVDKWKFLLSFFVAGNMEVSQFFVGKIFWKMRCVKCVPSATWMLFVDKHIIHVYIKIGNGISAFRDTVYKHSVWIMRIRRVHAYLHSSLSQI